MDFNKESVYMHQLQWIDTPYHQLSCMATVWRAETIHEATLSSSFDDLRRGNFAVTYLSNNKKVPKGFLSRFKPAG